jgi:hypothetical protein
MARGWSFSKKKSKKIEKKRIFAQKKEIENYFWLNGIIFSYVFGMIFS